MKPFLPFLAVLTFLAFSFAPSLVRAQDAPPPPDQGAPPPQDQGDQGMSFQNFYDQLGSQGNWVQTDDYGYVFQPNVSDPDWAPYTDGHWVYTDAGWTWVSDEPWGWATYHYGRWANIDGFGWVWVPGYCWAPAWVSWRYGGGYCGWAPLPPETIVGVGIGFHFGGDVDVGFNIGPGCYNFVAIGDMGERNYRGHYLDRSRNYAVINNTTNITNININGGASAGFRGVVVKGPPLSEVNAHSHQRIPTVQLTAANQPGPGHLQGNSLAVYAPRVNAASIKEARPARVTQTIAHPAFNRGDSITKPLDVTATVKPPPPSPEAIQAAQTAQLHAPAKAKIATEKTTVTPLTSLKPVAPVHETANAPFTGGSVKPAVTQPNEVKPTPTYQPQTQSSGGQTYHPPTTETSHPQTQSSETLSQSWGTAPKETSHPQTQSSGGQTYHPPTTETYHPQTQSSGGQTYHPSNTPPPTTYHPQTQPQEQPRQQQGGGGGGGGGGGDKGHAGNTNNAPGH